MELIVLPDAAAVASAAADRFLTIVSERPEAAVALPTGRTPLPFYEELARRADRGSDLGSLRVYNLDELLLPASHPHSFAAYMRRHVFGATGLDPARADIPDGEVSDVTAECRRYESAARAARLELAVLGVGADGHVGYNLPGQAAEETHGVVLPDELASQLEVPQGERPLRAITMGMGTIRSARSLLMLATGASKRAPVAALVAGERTESLPCTALLGHPDFVLLADRAAANGD